MGEIALVVIGILLALQLNSWAEERSDRKSEQLYLTQMLGEINGDIELLEAKLKKLKAQLPPLIQLLDLLYQKEVMMEEFNEHFLNHINASWYAKEFSANPATYEEMKSSGRLGLVKNKNLRNSIVQLYGNLLKTETAVREVTEFGRPIAQQWAVTLGGAKFRDLQTELFSRHLRSEDIYEMYQYKDELINAIAYEHGAINELSPIMEEQLEELRTVAKQIEDELPPIKKPVQNFPKESRE